MLFHGKLCQSSFVWYVSQLCSCFNCASNLCLEIIHFGLVQVAPCQSEADGVIAQVWGQQVCFWTLFLVPCSPEKGDFESVLGKRLKILISVLCTENREYNSLCSLSAPFGKDLISLFVRFVTRDFFEVVTKKISKITSGKIF